ncbi:MAG TPA: sigma-70 family RNA polymerase sigma factor, partial [Planctomycetaceae bacterium]|nr:sigma-70 family RNA polymerase sigma factor [Planctomycetaceae bacterium]
DACMLRMQGGDRRAFDEIVARHQSALIGFFIRNLRDAQLAEDLAQETLLRVYNQSWDYLPRGTFRAWMFRIARNALIDCTRRRSHDALVRAIRCSGGNENDDGMSRLVGDDVAPLERADQREIVRLVDAILPELPEDQRATFILYHYMGLSLPDIADATESNLPTCKSRLRLAREKLREKLLERGVADPGIPEND